MKKAGIGVIGCGDIAEIYLKNIALYDNIELVAVANRTRSRAEEKAKLHGCKVMEVDELINCPDIDIILNLTNPDAHYSLNLKALDAGKHVYSEKPLAATFEQAKDLVKTAKEKGLLIGCAPDTFLGARPQTMRKMLDEGWIGEPVAASAFFANRGPENYHPGPAPWYKEGGGPTLDIGPYYMSFLVHMFGAAESVVSMSKISFEERTITNGPLYGEKVKVEVPTHVTGTVKFKNGVLCTVILSFDVCDTMLPRVEIYGKEGTMIMHDDDPLGGPDRYGGPLLYRRIEDADFRMGPADDVPRTPWKDVPLCFDYRENSRAIGLSDMARAVLKGGDFRANGDFALHSLEIQHALIESAKTLTPYILTTTCERPAPMKNGVKYTVE